MIVTNYETATEWPSLKIIFTPKMSLKYHTLPCLSAQSTKITITIPLMVIIDLNYQRSVRNQRKKRSCAFLEQCFRSTYSHEPWLRSHESNHLVPPVPVGLSRIINMLRWVTSITHRGASELKKKAIESAISHPRSTLHILCPHCNRPF